MNKTMLGGHSVRVHGLAFVLGIAAGTFVLIGAGQDQVSGVSGLAPIAVAFATVSGGEGYVIGIILNGLAFVVTAAVIRNLWRSRRWASILVMILVGLWILVPLASSQAERRLQPYTETVMTPGMRITATTLSGPLEITAGQGTRRRYRGAGWNKSLALIARSERWFGSLGLYDPAESFSPYGRLLVDEGCLYFPSTSQAMGWLRGQIREAGSPADRPIYTDDGLVLRYSNSPVPGSGVPTHSIELWQLYVEGHRPRGLPGAIDSAIRVEGGTVADGSTPHVPPTGAP